MSLEPRVPDHIHPLAREVLERLARQPAGRGVIIGGGVALQHYCEFRGTLDLDAWWSADASEATERLIEAAMTEVAERNGLELAVRSWRETWSYELKRLDTRRAVFSFQISRRSVELEPPLESAWAPVRIETFSDNLGAKMSALVDRGAPRDFLDVYEVCRRDLVSVDDCWDLWRRKNPGLTIDEGKVRILHHLETLSARRPLESIPDASSRESARVVRQWIRSSLCNKEARHGGD